MWPSSASVCAWRRYLWPSSVSVCAWHRYLWPSSVSVCAWHRYLWPSSASVCAWRRYLCGLPQRVFVPGVGTCGLVVIGEALPWNLCNSNHPPIITVL